MQPFDVFCYLEIDHLVFQSRDLKFSMKSLEQGSTDHKEYWVIRSPKILQWTLSLFLEVQGRKPWEPLKRPKPGNHETSERALLPSSKAVIDNAKNKIALIQFIFFNFWSGIKSFAYLYSEPETHAIYYLSDIIHWQFCDTKTLHKCR